MPSEDIKIKQERIAKSKEDAAKQNEQPEPQQQQQVQPLIPYLSDCFNHFATSWFALVQQLTMAMQVPDDVELTLNDTPMTEEQRQGFKAGVEFCLEQMGTFKENTLTKTLDESKAKQNESS